MRDGNLKATVARFGPYEADFGRHELRRSGVRIRLQGQPLKLLRILLEKQDRVVSHEELRRNLWPNDIFVKFDACLYTTLNKLRHALQEDAERPLFIETIPREGYRFIAPVSWMESPVSARPPSSAAVAPASEQADIAPRSQANLLPGFWGPFNLRRLTAGALLCLAMIAVTITFFGVPAPRTSASKGDKVVILVMPFDNLSTDHLQDYLSEGFTEEMIAQLGSKYPRCLSVLSKPYAAQLKSNRMPLDRVAREFGIHYVLEGSIRSSEDHVRITAQLFRAPDQTSMWAGTYDVETTGDIIAVESEISTRITESLALEIVPYAHWIPPVLILPKMAWKASG